MTLARSILFLSLIVLAGLAMAADDVLISVNGEAITSSDLDAMIMDLHRSGMTDASNADLVRLLDKSVNDRLLVQDALAMGIDQEDETQRALDEILMAHAVEAMVADSFVPPAPVSEDSVRFDFERYFHRVSLRQLSLRTFEEIEAAQKAILAGADMDSIAQASSLDVHRFQGGLHSLKPWADVELDIRAAVVDLASGELSEPFAYRESYSMVRVEERLPYLEEDWEKEAPKLRTHRRVVARDDAWTAYVDSLRTVTPVHFNAAAMGVIKADADILWTPDFVNGSDIPAMFIQGGPTLAEGALRRTISLVAMENGTEPFDVILDLAVDKEEERILLRAASTSGNYTTNDGVLAAWTRERDQILINTYLEELIVPGIKFRRDEFEAFYEEHADDFRGPEEVRLDVIVAPDEDTAREMESRLAEGADFKYIRDEYVPGSVSRAEWAPLSVFSGAMIKQLETMENGQTSTPIPIPTGWMIFQLVERRQGSASHLEEVEMEIRKVMFQRKFNELMDAHLDQLKEHSQIVRHEDRIKGYFEIGTE